MNESTDEAVEKALHAALATEAELEAEPFTTAVMERIDRAVRRRRALLMAAYAAAIAIVVVNVPDVAASAVAMTPALLAGTMMLAAVCGMVWIATAD